MRKSSSAKQAARTAKAQAKRKAIEEKRAARALAKVEKTKAETVTTETIDRLAGELKTLVDNAMSVMGSAMRDAAERAYTLQQTYHLSQSEIGMKIGRSQPWVSGLLAWRLAGYPATPFGPQSKEKRTAKLLGAPNNPDPKIGMPDGPKLTLLSDDSIIVTADTDAAETETETETERLKAGQAPSTLIHNGKAHPDKGAPMSPPKATNGGSAPIKKAPGANPDVLVSFATTVNYLYDTFVDVKPSTLVAADVDMAKVKKVTAFLEAFIAQKAEHDKRHAQAAKFAAAHNETVEQHAANENAAPSAEAA